MIFFTPGKNGIKFEIDDEWWHQAGMHEFEPSGDSDSTQGKNCEIVPLAEIAPPQRKPGITLIRKNRMIKILKDFSKNSPTYPIEVKKSDIPGYVYKVHHGTHRFYASVAVGFSKIPITIRYDV